MSSKFPSIRRIPTECSAGGGGPQGRGLMGMVMVISASESDSWLLLSGSEPSSQLDVKGWGCLLLTEVVSAWSFRLRCWVQLCAAVCFYFTSGLLVVFYLCDGALTVSVGCTIQRPVLKNVLNNWSTTYSFFFAKMLKASFLDILNPEYTSICKSRKLAAPF